MKIKMLVGIAGVDFSLSPGDETERFPTEEADRLIVAGYAEPLVETREMAVKKSGSEKR